MHSKIDLVSFFNTPERLKRIADVSVTISQHYVGDIPQLCWNVSEPLAAEAKTVLAINKEVDATATKFPKGIGFDRLAFLSREMMSRELKSRLLLCEVLFENEVDESRIMSVFTGKIMHLSQKNEAIFGDKMLIEDN